MATDTISFMGVKLPRGTRTVTPEELLRLERAQRQAAQTEVERRDQIAAMRRAEAEAAAWRKKLGVTPWREHPELVKAQAQYAAATARAATARDTAAAARDAVSSASEAAREAEMAFLLSDEDRALGKANDKAAKALRETEHDLAKAEARSIAAGREAAAAATAVTEAEHRAKAEAVESVRRKYDAVHDEMARTLRVAHEAAETAVRLAAWAQGEFPNRPALDTPPPEFPHAAGLHPATPSRVKRELSLLLQSRDLAPRGGK